MKQRQKSVTARWGMTKKWLAAFRAGQVVPVTDPAAKNRVYAAAKALAMRVASHAQGLIVIWDGRQRHDANAPAIPGPTGLASVMARCPVCQAEFLPLRCTQETCGKARCTRHKSISRAVMCECGRGPKLTRNLGCSQCEADSERFYGSAAAHKRRLAAAAERETAT